MTRRKFDETVINELELMERKEVQWNHTSRTRVYYGRLCLSQRKTHGKYFLLH